MKLLKVLFLKNDSSKKLLDEFQNEGPGKCKYPNQEKGLTNQWITKSLEWLNQGKLWGSANLNPLYEKTDYLHPRRAEWQGKIVEEKQVICFVTAEAN